MSRKWIEREGPRWVEAGIVTPEQVRSIAGLYDDKSRAVALLPLLGGILLGAGILSFIAANWASIPALARLVMIIAAMLGFYGAGERVLRQGHDRTGIALIGLGWVCFGGGIILLGQTFHLMSYGAGSLILWGAAGLALAYVYASRYLLLLALAACHIAQAYSLGEFETFSYAAALLIVAAGWLAYKRGDAPLLLLVSLSAAAQSLLWVASGELRFLWMLVPLFVLYAAGDWLSDRELGIALQSGALVSGVPLRRMGGRCSPETHGSSATASGCGRSRGRISPRWQRCLPSRYGENTAKAGQRKRPIGSLPSRSCTCRPAWRCCI